MSNARIIIEKVKHSGQEVDCYVPQVSTLVDWTPENGYTKWIDILPQGSYILKESFNPIIVCKKCDAEGCNDCNNRGFRKGTPVDLKHIAEMLLDIKMKELNKADKVLRDIGVIGNGMMR